MRRIFALSGLSLLVMAISWPNPNGDKVSKRIRKEFMNAAETYSSYPDDSLLLKKMYVSNCDEPGGHDQLLFKLFASKPGLYSDPREKQPIGQMLVMESWSATPVLPGQGAMASEQPAKAGNPDYTGGVTTDREGTVYTTGVKGPLFLMYKQSTEEDEKTDEGWVYAVISEDRRTINKAGKIESCISCHKKANQDRIFGLQANN